jgi:hypothetical protein
VTNESRIQSRFLCDSSKSVELGQNQIANAAYPKGDGVETYFIVLSLGGFR